MIVAVPAAMPVTMPVEEPIVAIVVVLLLHVPPAIGLLSAVVPPGHTLAVPVMAGGGGITVTVVVIAQPVPGAV